MKKNILLLTCLAFLGLGSLSAQTALRTYSDSRLLINDGANLHVQGATQNGSQIDVKGQGSVDLHGNLNLDDATTFTLLSEGRGATGSLIGYNTTTTANGSGRIVAQRYLTSTGKGDDKWHYFTAPVSGQPINDAWVGANNIGHVMASNNNVGIDFWRWDEPAGAWYQRLSVNENFNDNEFTSGAGYIGAVQNSNQDANFSFAGNDFNAPAVGGQVGQGVTHTAAQNTPPSQCFNGWNLIGNPYPSAYKVTGANSFLENTTEMSKLEDYNQALYLYVQSDAAEGNTFNGIVFNKVADYQIISKSGFNNDGFAYYDEDGGLLETGTFTTINQEYIAPGQAFFVRVKSGNSNLNFPADYRAHAFGTQAEFHKKSKDGGEDESWPGFVLLANNEKHHASAAVVSFNDAMTTALDPGCDVAKLEVRSNQQTISIYTQMLDGDADVKMAEQSLPTETQGEYGSEMAAYEIPVGVDVTSTSVVDFMSIQKHLDGEKIILEDRKLGVFTDVNKDKYSTTCEKLENGLGRFFIHVGKKVESIATGEYDGLQITTYMEDKNHLVLLNPAKVIGDYQIFDMNGSLLHDGRLNGDNKQTINVDIAFGMYVIKVYTNYKTQSFKFINK